MPFTNYKSILSTYSKPLYLSPLAFILLLLENFLFAIALFFGGNFRRCLIGDPVSGGMNGMAPAGTPRHPFIGGAAQAFWATARVDMFR
jgi:hypothetical protein